MAVAGGIARSFSQIAFDGNWDRVTAPGDAGSLFTLVARSLAPIFIDDMTTPWNNGPLPVGTIVTLDMAARWVIVTLP